MSAQAQVQVASAATTASPLDVHAQALRYGQDAGPMRSGLDGGGEAEAATASPPSDDIDKSSLADSKLEAGRGRGLSDTHGPGPASSEGDEDEQSAALVGVKNSKAVIGTWSKTVVVLVYAIIWIIYLVYGLMQNSLPILAAFVTSAFASHSLTPTITVVASIVSGVLLFAYAKIIDIFGRLHGILVGTAIGVVGIAVMAGCKNVETYAAADVFWVVGQSCTLFTVNILIADMSSLRNRALMLAFAASPNLIVIWIAGYFNDAYIAGPGWRWAFGTFSILLPAVTLPLGALLAFYTRRASRCGLMVRRQSQKSIPAAVLFYLREFDVVGLLLISLGFSLFLLPFNIYSLQPNGWQSPLVISTIVIGPVLIGAFVFWEVRFASPRFLPLQFLSNRTLLGACMTSAALFFSYTCWVSYFASFVMVVNDVTLQSATYISNIYGFGGTFFQLFLGWFLRKVCRFRAITLYFAVPLHMLGLGLMIHFRQPGQHIGYIVMCQVLISLAGCIVTLNTTIAAMASVPHKDIALAIALVSIAGSVGSATGATVSAAIWQSAFAGSLLKHLPPADLEAFPLIYGDLITQLSYPVGSATRIAIQKAYGDAQAKTLAAGTSVWVLALFGAALWRDIDLKESVE